MAYFKKLPSGKHRAWVEVGKVRKTATRDSKAEVRNWAIAEEAALKSATHGQYPNKTVADAVAAYLKSKSAHKPGARWEELRLNAFLRNFPALATKTVSKVDAPDMAAWRDARLEQVSSGTVLREWNLLSNLFHTAADEWKWCAGTPFKGVQAPRDNPARRRRTQPSEIKQICRWLGYRTGHIETKMQEVAFAYLVALRTSLRSQEVLQLGDDCVNFDTSVAVIKRHKMGHKTGEPKVVPLLPEAVRLLKTVRGRGRYFTVSSGSRDTLFRKARDALLIDDLKFHDAKAEILTRLSRKVDVMTLSRISGNKDLRVLMDTYYRETAEDIADRLR